jgi:tripartite ATP-independent transporter DctP family solute receptor
MKNVKTVGRILLCFMLAAFLFSTPAFATKTIKLAHVASPKQPYAIACIKFKELAESRSKGELEVKVYPAAQLGNNDAILAAVKMGDIQTSITPYPKLGDIVKEMTLLVGGYIFRDFEHQNAVLESSLGKSWEKELIKRGGLRILSSVYYGVRQLTTTKKAVYSPKDLKGMKIRSVPNPMSQAVVTGMGATPTPVPFPELFNALRQGVVDGQENPLNTIWTQKLYELQEYLILTGHQLISLPLVVNSDFFDGLSADQQKILKDAAKEAFAYGTQLTIEQEQSQLDNLKKKGMTVIGKKEGLDLNAFREAVTKVVRERFEDKLGKELFEEIAEY